MRSVILSWIPFVVVITGIMGMMYAVVQQNYRQSLNDPQIQMAEDAVNALDRGLLPTAIVPHGARIDVSRSLAPFIAVYDERTALLETSGVIGGSLPTPPQGVFELARTRGNNLPHNTWQPQPDVRIAAVLMHTPQNHGFVLTGRNMRVVEDREHSLLQMTLLGWLVLLGISFITSVFVHRSSRNRH